MERGRRKIRDALRPPARVDRPAWPESRLVRRVSAQIMSNNHTAGVAKACFYYPVGRTYRFLTNCPKYMSLSFLIGRYDRSLL
jgi:hypothetical protein